MKHLALAVSGDGYLQKLSAMMERYSSTVLNILAREDGRVQVIHPSGGTHVQNEFCNLICQTDEGLKRCSTCRYLIACACHDRLARFRCHGGITVLAAPVCRCAGDLADFLLVTSGPFRRADGEDQWQDVLEHFRGLPVQSRDMRAGYEKLPLLDESQQNLTGEIVELAALRMGELVKCVASQDTPRSKALDAPDLLSADVDYKLALSLSQDGELADSGVPALVRLVEAIVSRNPELLFSVDKIARAAHITPNYFSALFKQHTGKTFRQFLSEQRLKRAENLLRDLSLNINEVAERSGFQDSNYFSRTFRRHTGMTPTHWRKSHLFADQAPEH